MTTLWGLAPRELVRVAIGQSGIQPDLPHQLGDLIDVRAEPRTVASRERLRDGQTDAEPRIQCRERTLRDCLDEPFPGTSIAADSRSRTVR